MCRTDRHPAYEAARLRGWPGGRAPGPAGWHARSRLRQSAVLPQSLGEGAVDPLVPAGHISGDWAVSGGTEQGDGGLVAGGAELIRIGSNAVYRLRYRVIVRITRADRSAADAHKQIAVARWLAAVGYPAVRALEVEQPITAERHVATFWDSVSEHEDYASVFQVAELIRRLHELDAPDLLALPEMKPFDKANNSLNTIRGLTPSDFEYLSTRLTELQSEYDGVEYALQPGPIHGDANVGNVILDRQDEPVLIDLDNFCIGPREWDLVQTALFCERFGWHTEEEYRTFVKVYGFDIMSWPGYRLLADIREVMMILWLGRRAEENESAAVETRRRIQALRTGASRRDWVPF